MKVTVNYNREDGESMEAVTEDVDRQPRLDLDGDLTVIPRGEGSLVLYVKGEWNWYRVDS